MSSDSNSPLRGLSKRVRRRLAETLIPRRLTIAEIGRNVRISRSTHVSGGSHIRIGDDVSIAGHGWILVPGHEKRSGSDPVISIASGTSIGEACTISAVNHVHIHSNVLFGPRVWVTDHNHEYADITRPIQDQGWTADGSVDIEENCWIGTGAVIIGARPLTIGRGSVVGANSVVTSDVPAFSVVAGNPARLVRRYDAATSTWHRVVQP